MFRLALIDLSARDCASPLIQKPAESRTRLNPADQKEITPRQQQENANPRQNRILFAIGSIFVFAKLMNRFRVDHELANIGLLDVFSAPKKKRNPMRHVQTDTGR